MTIMARPDSKTAVNANVDNEIFQRFDQARMQIGQNRTTAISRALELYACFLSGQEIRPDFKFSTLGPSREGMEGAGGV